MSWAIVLVVLVVAGLIARAFFSAHGLLESGQQSPDFKLADQQGKMHTLADYHGKWLALYFYPKDDTPGCTLQACAFRDDLQKLKALDADVLGVSVDSVNSHASFASKFGLPFPLLADYTTETAARYHSLINLSVVKFARRNTFLIDPEGKIAKVYPSASALNNSGDIIADLKQLKHAQRLSEIAEKGRSQPL